MSDAFFRIRDALIARTGHHYYADKDKLLLDRLRERIQATQCATLEAYELHLAAADGEAEWRALEDVITVGETYFFRHADHFDALRNRILPDLLRHRREERALRIWSIGCANGAEAHSVAIVLRELLGDDFENWRIVFVGGDISDRALAAAREAVYGQWALRAVSDADRSRYFEQLTPRSWRLRRPFRFVRFERQNLLSILSPSAPLQWTDFDLILCRNVLIYFSTEQASALAQALRARLAPDGVLLLGHAESILLSHALPAPMPEPQPSEFERSLQPTAPAPWMPLALPDAPLPPPAPIAQALASANDGADASLHELRAAADAGAYQHAQALSAALLQAQPLSPILHYYKAVLDLLCDDAVAAEASLRKALYLDRNFILAHHRLGLLLLSRGRARDARRSLQAAVELAAALPGDALLPEGEGATAAAFLDAARHTLEDAA